MREDHETPHLRLHQHYLLRLLRGAHPHGEVQRGTGAADHQGSQGVLAARAAAGGVWDAGVEGRGDVWELWREVSQVSM